MPYNSRKQQSAKLRDTEVKDEDKVFYLKRRIEEMTTYALPILREFPRRDKELADNMKTAIFDILHDIIRIEKKTYKKTTLEDMDAELAFLKFLVIVASDKEYSGEKFAPPLSMKQREVWSRYNMEIGNLIGGYMKYVKSNPPKPN